MKIGYYCPLVGEVFLKNLGTIPVDLRSIDYNSRDTEFCHSGSNKCSLVCWMSGLIQDNHSLDGIILTNCCHEQEQLVDFLNSVDTMKVFKLNIPRNRSTASVRFLADQLEAFVRQIFGSSSGTANLRQQPLNSAPKPQNESKLGFLPVMVFGISIPPWLNGLLKENGLLPVVQDCCGFIPGEGRQPPPANVDIISGYAETIIYRSFCIRNTSQENGLPLLSAGYGIRLPLAVLFISLEYCTTSSYGFVKIKDFFASKQIPVFKISITEWNKPLDKVITQIESIAHICKEIKDEPLY